MQFCASLSCTPCREHPYWVRLARQHLTITKTPLSFGVFFANKRPGLFFFDRFSCAGANRNLATDDHVFL
jgi:hypothetical protein